jgi:hypothetical protein
MPLTVELWTELTNPTVEGRVVGVKLPRDLATDDHFHLLKWVDPWGDTVFNRAQCSDLVAELALACDHFEKGTFAEMKALAEVKALAERAAAEPHSYLVFVGD